MRTRIEKPRLYWIHLKMALLACVITLLYGAVLVRVYLLQTVQKADLSKKAEVQSNRVVKMKAKRGSIYDRNGVELAVSVEVPSIAMRPKLLSNPEKTAEELSKILGERKEELYQKTTSKRNFLWLVRQTTPEIAAAVRRLNEKGLETVRENRRFYPRASLAGQLIGFTDIDGKGREGIEKAFNSTLAGKESEMRGVRDAHGRTLLTDSLPKFKGFEGKSLILTIDERIQEEAEKVITETVSKFSAKGGYAIVMDVKTGDILAMANTPTFNPNFYGEYNPGAYRLRNVTDTFEPGSIAKPIVAAAALQEKSVDLSTKIDCEGGMIWIGKYRIRDSHRNNTLSVAEVLQHSSNIGMYKIAQTVGKQKLYDYLKAFGFGSRTEVGLNGEQAGVVYPPSKWAEVTFANIAFGQGITATPLQLVTAISAIANDGLLMQPQIIKRVIDKDDKVVKERQPTLIRPVVSKSVAKKVAWALSLVTREGGTGRNAAMENFTVAGKTGTAQKVNPKTRHYDPKLWTASFLGFVPAEKPEIAILVMIDEPEENHYGGVVAAPAFKQIAQKALAIRGTNIIPSKKRFKFYDAQEMRNKYREEAKKEKMKATTTVLELPDAQLPPLKIKSGGKDTMPDLRGMTLKEALERSRKSGFLPNVTGWGKVVSQNPNPGDSLINVKEIDIKLAPNEEETPFANEPSQGDTE